MRIWIIAALIVMVLIAVGILPMAKDGDDWDD